MEFKVDIPCTHLVRVYLENTYGSPVKFTEGLPKSIFNCHVQKQMCINQKVRERRWSDELTVVLTESVYLRHGVFMTDKAVSDFNNDITDIIYQLLFFTMGWTEEMFTSGGSKLKIRDSIEKFCDKLHLPEECFSYERAKKAWYRERKRENALRVSA